MGAGHNFKGEFEDANKYFEKTIELDPFSLINLVYIAGYQTCDGDYNKMIDIGNRLIAMEPSFFGGYTQIGNGYFFSGQYEKAIEQFEIASQLFTDVFTLSTLGEAHGRSGNKLKAEEVIESMKKFTSCCSLTEEIIAASKPKKADRIQSEIAASFLENPSLINL